MGVAHSHRERETLRERIYLYTYEDGTWGTGYVIGVHGIIQSVETGAACPAAVTQWQWWYLEDGWHSGDIAATCTDHI